MLVLLDVDKKEILLYGEKGLHKIPFSSAQILSTYTQNQNVMYVTNAMEVKTQDVLDLIEQLGFSISQTATLETQSNQPLFLHVPSGKVINLSDIPLVFKGKYDFIPLNDEMKKNIKKYPILKNLVEKGEIAIVNRTVRDALAIQGQAEEDATLNSITVNPNISAAEMAEGIIDIDNIAETIDLTNEREGPKTETMSKLLAEIEGI